MDLQQDLHQMMMMSIDLQNRMHEVFLDTVQTTLIEVSHVIVDQRSLSLCITSVFAKYNDSIHSHYCIATRLHTFS